MQQPLFSSIDGAMIRVSTDDPRDSPVVSWPAGIADGDRAAWHGFIAKAWASGRLANAVELASPVLASAVRDILSGDVPDHKKAVRAGMAIARYLIRVRGRATPFGLFAGATTARIGPPSPDMRGMDHQVAARADSQWLTDLVTRLESCEPLRRRLRVTTNDLVTARGDRLIVGWLPQASALARDTPAEISLHRTPAAETALQFARTPVSVGELADRIAAEYAPAAPEQAAGMVSQLITCGALISEIRPPSTAADPLSWILDRLHAAGSAGFPAHEQATLRDTHAQLLRADAADLNGLAVLMGTPGSSAHPVAVDLRPDCRVTIPQNVADEAAAAASVLTRLSPQPSGPEGLRDYRSRFLDRYGLGTAVPFRELINPVTGLGLPPHYTARAAPVWTSRAGKLAELAQSAVLDMATEVVLDDAMITEIAGPESALTQPVPHMDLIIELRAASMQAAAEGKFMIAACGAGRTAMATSGRFLHLLPDLERDRLAAVYRDLPTATRGAITAQMSFPPHHPPAENVTRVPRLLPHLLSTGEYQGHDEPGRIPLDDLAVTASASRFHLISLRRRVPVEPVLACAPAWHAVPPAARLLFQLPRAHCAPPAVFDWGGASRLPFRPRIRFRRAVLSPAQWQIRPGDLPGPNASHGEWTAALHRLRGRRQLPDWVSAGAGDQQLRLCLDQPMDLAVLRDHLDGGGGTGVLSEAWTPDDHAWCGGRAHQFVIPLAASVPPGSPPAVLARRDPLPSADRQQTWMPGTGHVLSARLYSDPALFDIIMTEQFPGLADGWDGLSAWWFIRYRDPRHHLRLRLHVTDCGEAAARTGQWASELRRQGLADDLLLDTYRPETGRYGCGPAMAAAETLFAADSAAATAQIAAATVIDAHALTAASLADLSAALLGGRHAGMQWLTAHPVPAGPQPLARDTRQQALALTSPADGNPVPAAVRRAWSARADAAGEYAELLAEGGRDPADIVETLLHLHHNRVHGPGPAGEALTYRLARACALRHSATTDQR